MSKILTRAAALEAYVLRTEDVPVPEWGGDVRIRELTAGDAAEFGNKVTKGEDKEAMIVWIIGSAVDEEGNPLFEDTPDTRAALAKKGASAIMRLGNAVLKLNGLLKEEVKEQEKN